MVIEATFLILCVSLIFSIHRIASAIDRASADITSALREIKRPTNTATFVVGNKKEERGVPKDLIDRFNPDAMLEELNIYKERE